MVYLFCFENVVLPFQQQSNESLSLGCREIQFTSPYLTCEFEFTGKPEMETRLTAVEKGEQHSQNKIIIWSRQLS